MFTSQNLTVLYIEHDPEIQQKFTRLMRENGLQVIATDNTLDACNLFRMHEVDIILIDEQLPNKSGIDFVHCLRGKEVLTPVVITTEYTNQNMLLEAINLDITRYLVKPYPQHELLNALQAAINKAINCHPITFTRLDNGFSYDPINKVINGPDGVTHQLSKKEYLLLELLIKNKNKIISYDAIAILVWQDSIMSMDALRTLVRGIRKKTYNKIIENNNGIGYKMHL